MTFEEEISKRLESSKGLIMSRVPIKTKIQFIQLAKDHFEGDYGMALKFLIDNFVLTETLKNLEYKINYLIEMAERKEIKPDKKPDKEIKLLSGKKIKIGGKE